jgi:hypothetical protein
MHEEGEEEGSCWSEEEEEEDSQKNWTTSRAYIVQLERLLTSAGHRRKEPRLYAQCCETALTTASFKILD